MSRAFGLRCFVFSTILALLLVGSGGGDDKKSEATPKADRETSKETLAGNLRDRPRPPLPVPAVVGFNLTSHTLARAVMIPVYGH
jgi:hypothetical protein